MNAPGIIGKSSEDLATEWSESQPKPISGRCLICLCWRVLATSCSPRDLLTPPLPSHGLCADCAVAR